jgi:hypothetical protein
MADMIDKIKRLETDIPQWDVALASLVTEEFGKLGRGLRLGDFQRLATQHAIRFDDIMATLFELVLHGEWRYEDPPGVKFILTRDEVEKLYVGGRISTADVNQYSGQWLPNR